MKSGSPQSPARPLTWTQRKEWVIAAPWPPSSSLRFPPAPRRGRPSKGEETAVAVHCPPPSLCLFVFECNCSLVWEEGKWTREKREQSLQIKSKMHPPLEIAKEKKNRGWSRHGVFITHIHQPKCFERQETHCVCVCVGAVFGKFCGYKKEILFGSDASVWSPGLVTFMLSGFLPPLQNWSIKSLCSPSSRSSVFKSLIQLHEDLSCVFSEASSGLVNNQLLKVSGPFAFQKLESPTNHPELETRTRNRNCYSNCPTTERKSRL